MKLQDKIYVSNQTISTGKVCGLWFVNSEPDTSEYIRKDAILKKLETQQDKCIFRSIYWDLWQEVINEIKAL